MIQTDTESMDLLVSHLSLDRKGPQPIHVQLRNAVEVAIFSGGLEDQARLPSIRKLASTVGVAPNTVVRVYQDLERDGWITSTPKRAYYVTLGQDEPSVDHPAHPAKLDELIDRALSTAAEAGIDSSQLIRLIIDRSRTTDARVYNVAVIGVKEAFLDERVAIVAGAIADLPSEVIGISYDELESSNEKAIPSLEEIDCFLVPVGEVEEAAKLLGDRAHRILPMTRALPIEIQEFFRAQPQSTIFGAVSGSVETVGRIVAAINHFHPLDSPPLTASIDNPASVQDVIEHAEVLVIGTRARAYISSLDPIEKPTVNLFYEPDQRTLETLRRRLTAI